MAELNNFLKTLFNFVVELVCFCAKKVKIQLVAVERIITIVETGISGSFDARGFEVAGLS